MNDPTFEDDPDRIIEHFLEGAPNANTWKSLHTILVDRLTHLRAQIALVPPQEQIRLKKQILELEQQVRVLAEEEAITRFVEDSIRATISLPNQEDIDINT